MLKGSLFTIIEVVSALGKLVDTLGSLEGKIIETFILDIYIGWIRRYCFVKSEAKVISIESCFLVCLETPINSSEAPKVYLSCVSSSNKCQEE